MINRLLIAIVTGGAGALAACGGYASGSGTPAVGSSSSGGATATPATATATPAAAGPSTIVTGSTSLGTVLTDAQGHTLYYFVREKGGVVVCTGGCASTWPPLKASGTATKPSDVPGTLGSVALSDGSTQVTYNGWPLHTYAADSGPGQTNGQGVGGMWYVATPGTTANGAAASAATPSSTPYGY